MDSSSMFLKIVLFLLAMVLGLNAQKHECDTDRDCQKYDPKLICCHISIGQVCTFGKPPGHCPPQFGLLPVPRRPLLNNPTWCFPPLCDDEVLP
ncbi:hypothetical protein Ddc_10891 [Ditylenchus destructor]|nr:hypothetical protein Ddc_10891 [Ditylenchus destructor]